MTDTLIKLGWERLDDRSGLHLMADLVVDDPRIVVGRKYSIPTIENIKSSQGTDRWAAITGMLEQRSNSTKFLHISDRQNHICLI